MRKRPLLVVGAGAVIVTVLEGIACGNPVSPRCPGPRCSMPQDAAVEAGTEAGTDGPAATPGDAGIDTPTP
jgi:hypothetical protein